MELLAFASTAAKSVCSLALDLSKEESADDAAAGINPTTKPFYNALVNSLSAVHRHLESPESTNIGGNKLAKLLNELERLCNWENKVNSRTLNQQDLTDPYTAFPTLGGLEFDDEDETPKKNISLVAVRSSKSKKGLEYRQKLFELLRLFTPDTGQLAVDTSDSRSLTRMQADQHMIDNLRADTQLHYSSMIQLYNVLSKYSVCHENDKVVTRIATRLRLNVDQLATNAAPVFSVLFLSHPHKTETVASRKWRSTKIYVCSGQNSAFAIRNDYLSHQEHVVCIDQKELCLKLRPEEPHHLPLLLSNEALTVEEENEKMKSELHFLDSKLGSASLASILADRSLRNSPRLRCILAFVLARAFWQFIGTSWMSRPWIMEDVHFMSECRSKPTWGYFLSEPFISAKFDHNADPDMWTEPSVSCDRLQMLGILLLELEKGFSVKRRAANEFKFRDPAHALKLSVAKNIVENDTEMMETLSEFREVIKECLNLTKLKSRLYKGHHIQPLRMAIQENVVTPLRKLVSLWIRNPEKIPCLEPDIKQDTTDFTRLERNQSFDNKDEDGTPRKGQNGATSKFLKSPSSDPWFNEIERLGMIFDGKIGSGDRIKIAILDTGLEPAKPGCPEIELAGYRDFTTGKEDDSMDREDDKIDREDDRIDKVGHGTKGVNLLRYIFPNAEIYVARIFEEKEEEEGTKGYMLQAIEWAHKKWAVNIVATATGFDRDDEPIDRKIEQAILSAAAENILFFAAAGNYGPLKRIRFPARMQNPVFCMFSTDAGAAIAGKSASNNPSPAINAGNFAILGENVEFPDDRGVSKKMTGTSASTYIAAGLAGHFLAFAAQDDICTNLLRADTLKRFNGMSKLFIYLTQSSHHSGYRSITLEKLLADAQYMDNERARDHIRTKIQEALEG